MKQINVSEIDWVRNIFLPSQTPIILSEKELIEITWNNNISKVILSYQENLYKLLEEKINTLLDLESALKNNFSTEPTYLDEQWFVRLANCIAWKDTQIHRDANAIILTDWQTQVPTKTNMEQKVIDPIGWSSKWIAPSLGYWILWKIPELRPMSPEFNEKVYNEIMNTKISIEMVWISFESWEQEIVIMPTYKIAWWDNIISDYSEERRKDDIQTAKHYWINS